MLFHNYQLNLLHYQQGCRRLREDGSYLHVVSQIGLPYGDEINHVDPGFNSGYGKIDGTWLPGDII